MGGFSSSGLIRKANEVVSIHTVCEALGVDFSSYYGSRSKLYCPFGGVNHIDGGDSKAFKVYEDTNSAYCFACAQYYDPVSLYALAEDVTKESAAEALLEMSGWKEETFEEKWDRLSGGDNQGYDNSNLPEALNVYCARLDPDWVVNQLEEPFSSAIARCNAVAARVKDAAQADKWLTTSKKLMKGLIDDSVR